MRSELINTLNAKLIAMNPNISIFIQHATNKSLCGYINKMSGYDKKKQKLSINTLQFNLCSLKKTAKHGERLKTERL